MKNTSLKLLMSILSLSIFFSPLFAQQKLTLKIGSYNIRYDNEGDRKAGNSWEDRLPVIGSILRWEDADVFGAQEVLAGQLEDMRKELKGYGDYGIGRDDGKDKGEFAPIFYKKDKFELLESGSFWLSENPEEPSKGWDAALPRITSWVKLQDKETEKEFWFFNLHMDHVGKIAREESSHLVLEKMKEIVGDGTAFLTGDFNVDQKNKIYDILQESGYIFDSYEQADDRMAINGTFNAFNDQLWTDSRIDHIFVTKNVSVSNYAVRTDTYRSKIKDAEDIKEGDFPEELSFKGYIARLPSDHFPIFARVSF